MSAFICSDKHIATIAVAYVSPECPVIIGERGEEDDQ